MSLEQLITITLFGRPYTFKAESELKNARAVADSLVQEVQKIESRQADRTSDLNKFAILISAALNIANENIELKNAYSNLLQDLAHRSNNVIRALDTYIH